MSRIIHRAKSLGAEVVGAVMFTDSPFHTDDYYATKVREMAQLPIDGVYLEDTAGVMTPQRVTTLIPAIQSATDKPIEVHFHNTTGLAPVCYVEALRLGVRTLHTALPPLADSGSLPSTKLMVKLIEQLNLQSTIDTAHFEPVREHLEFVAGREGYILGGSTEYDLDVYGHQIPGGMMGTLKVQLSELGLSDRLDEILEETAIVRRELGYPGMATPLSQFAGIQAALNLLTGDRYSQVPVEVARYLLGYYGEPVGPVDQNVLDRVTDSPLAKKIERELTEQPSLEDLRRQYGDVDDDELILRATMAAKDVDAMVSAGTIPLDYPRPLVRTVKRLLERPSVRSASCETSTFAVTLTRNAPAY
jgi:oxaloacetate decarboxylase alpha subunit